MKMTLDIYGRQTGGSAAVPREQGLLGLWEMEAAVFQDTEQLHANLQLSPPP